MQNTIIILMCCLTLIGCNENKSTTGNEFSGSQLQLANQNLLQGKWQNTEDLKSYVLFDGSIRIETYEGSNAISGREFLIADKCSSNPSTNKPKEMDRYIQIINPKSCFYIVQLDTSKLELLDVGTGISTKYKRVE